MAKQPSKPRKENEPRAQRRAQFEERPRPRITPATFLITALVVGVVVAAVVFSTAGSVQSGPASQRQPGVLSVNDIKGDPFAYKGTVTITGVVAEISRQDPKLFGLIDTSEAVLCKTTGCANYYLAVRSDSPAPRVWDEVTLTGSFTKTPQGQPLFVPTKVDVLKHLTF